ncbi:hypothetical protein, partial [Brucella thiophenivorans]|uniref:hypothetical protein n=1 Tax=Brucella thiophenivorans TaxID=571255 RepID=UPI0035BBE2A4
LHAFIEKLNYGFDQNSFIIKSIALHRTCSAKCPILIQTKPAWLTEAYHSREMQKGIASLRR